MSLQICASGTRPVPAPNWGYSGTSHADPLVSGKYSPRTIDLYRSVCESSACGETGRRRRPDAGECFGTR